MQQPVLTRSQPVATPSFHLISRQPLRPVAILLAMVTVVSVFSAVLYGLSHGRHAPLAVDGSGTGRSASDPHKAPQPDDEQDDPSQIDTIVLGDPADAPVPARRGDHVSPVHPTILVRLPRFGNQTGLIPDSEAGHLLYGWLAAFNQASYTGLANTLPNVASASSAVAQMEFRRQTGGFTLISAKEVRPGILVFRLRDQTPTATEVLGTLQVNSDLIPGTIASFSLRDVPATRQDGTAGSAPSAAASPR